MNTNLRLCKLVYLGKRKVGPLLCRGAAAPLAPLSRHFHAAELLVAAKLADAATRVRPLNFDSVQIYANSQNH